MGIYPGNSIKFLTKEYKEDKSCGKNQGTKFKKIKITEKTPNKTLITDISKSDNNKTKRNQ